MRFSVELVRVLTKIDPIRAPRLLRRLAGITQLPPLLMLPRHLEPGLIYTRAYKSEMSSRHHKIKSDVFIPLKLLNPCMH